MTRQRPVQTMDVVYDVSRRLKELVARHHASEVVVSTGKGQAKKGVDVLDQHRHYTKSEGTKVRRYEGTREPAFGHSA